MTTNPTSGPSEGQERSDESKLTSFVTKMVGHQRTMAAGFVEVADGLAAIAAGYEALQLDVEKIREAAYRAGREDAGLAVEALPADLTMSGFVTFGGVPFDGSEYLKRDKAIEIARGTS